MSDNAITQIATVLVALISLIGTLGVAYIQFKATRQKAKSDEAAAAEKRADEAEKEKKKAEERLAAELHQKELDAINARIDKTNSTFEEVSRNIKLISERIEKMHVKMTGRTAELEEKVAQVIELLSKYAQTYSIIVRQYERTNRRIGQLSEIETVNLHYTIASVEITESLLHVAREMHLNDPDKMARLDQIENQIHEVKASFTNALMESSMHAIDAQKEIASKTTLPKMSGLTPPAPSSHMDEIDTIMSEIATGVNSVLHELTGEEED